MSRSGFQLVWNAAELNERLEKTVAVVALAVGAEFTKAITDPIWAWPEGDTPRDIVDKGQLRAAQTMTRIGPFLFQFDWAVEYAAAVHEGATFQDGRTLPARPWTRVGLQRARPIELLARTWSLGA